MRKFIVSLVIACSTLFALNSCIVSDKKLTEKVQQAIVDDELSKGNRLEVTEFTLDDKDGQYKGVLKGQLNGQPVTYDVKATDDGKEFDVDWELRK